MPNATNTSIAFRVGQALGGLARFWLHDQNPTLRWLKRASVVVFLALVAYNSFSWLVSVMLTVLALGLGVAMLTKMDISQTPSQDRDAPYGRDAFGAPLDSWGDRRDGFDRD
ncbi:hypothetical protein [Pseudomonas sp. NPDC086566]|uniref:hypothetical protein n=1 Tax=Pseudomonas sp. NPDC086566 TaxID=3390647 RepID=UPI003D00CC8E